MMKLNTSFTVWWKYREYTKHTRLHIKYSSVTANMMMKLNTSFTVRWKYREYTKHTRIHIKYSSITAHMMMKLNTSFTVWRKYREYTKHTRLHIKYSSVTAHMMMKLNTSFTVSWKSTNQDNISVQCRCIPTFTPLLYSKTEVCRGILIFLQNIECGYSLEPPQRSINVLRNNTKIYRKTCPCNVHLYPP